MRPCTRTQASLAIESALETGVGGTPFVQLQPVRKAGHDLYELPAVADLQAGVGAVVTLTHLPDDTLAGAAPRAMSH